MSEERTCLNCHTPLINKRSHAKVCSDKCRVKRWRALKEQSVLIPFRMSVVNHTDLFLKSYAANLSMDVYLNKLVSNHLICSP